MKVLWARETVLKVGGNDLDSGHIFADGTDGIC